MRLSHPLLCFASVFVLVSGCAASGEDAAEATTAGAAATSDEDKTLYAMGLVLSRQLKGFQLSDKDLAAIQRGLNDGVLGNEPQIDLQEWGPKIQPFIEARVQAAGAERETAGKAFREKMAAEANAVTSPSGLIYIETQAGTGAAPTPASTVKVNYRGTFPDGAQFDSSPPDAPVSFSLASVVPCFSEGISKMKVGGKAKLVCPPAIAYGERGVAPNIPPNATLVFDIDLLEIEATPSPEAVPAP